MIVCYMAHPFGGLAHNLTRARRWFRWLSESFPNTAFEAGWILECEQFPEEYGGRERGMARNLARLARCDVLAMVGGSLSDGMRTEQVAAQSNGLDVADLLGMGGEPYDLSDVYGMDRAIELIEGGRGSKPAPTPAKGGPG